MSVIVTCECGQSFRAGPSLLGRTVACPKCRQPLSIPAAEPEPAALESLDLAADPFASPMPSSSPMSQGGAFETATLQAAAPSAAVGHAEGSPDMRIVYWSVGGAGAVLGLLFLAMVIPRLVSRAKSPVADVPAVASPAPSSPVMPSAPATPPATPPASVASSPAAPPPPAPASPAAPPSPPPEVAWSPIADSRLKFKFEMPAGFELKTHQINQSGTEAKYSTYSVDGGALCFFDIIEFVKVGPGAKNLRDPQVREATMLKHHAQAVQSGRGGESIASEEWITTDGLRGREARGKDRDYQVVRRIYITQDGVMLTVLCKWKPQHEAVAKRYLDSVRFTP